MPHLPYADVIALPHEAQTFSLVVYRDHDGTSYVTHAGATTLDSEPEADGSKEIIVSPGIGFRYEAGVLPQYQEYIGASGAMGSGDVNAWLFASDEDCRVAYEREIARGVTPVSHGPYAAN